MKLITQALLLGDSLAHNCRVQKRVLLITECVARSAVQELLHCYWDVRRVQPISVHCTSSDLCEETFKRESAKLRALELIEYEKIVLLDLDLLVLRNIDDLFAFETPAAVNLRHDHEDMNESVRSAGLAFKSNEKRSGSSIHAGVMVLRPSVSEFRHICAYANSLETKISFMSGSPGAGCSFL